MSFRFRVFRSALQQFTNLCKSQLQATSWTQTYQSQNHFIPRQQHKQNKGRKIFPSYDYHWKPVLVSRKLHLGQCERPLLPCFHCLLGIIEVCSICDLESWCRFSQKHLHRDATFFLLHFKKSFQGVLFCFCKTRGRQASGCHSASPQKNMDNSTHLRVLSFLFGI